MEKLRWVRRAPQVPGWYWFRNRKERDDKEPRICYVRDFAGRLAIGNSTLEGWKRMLEGEWAGPILPP